MNQLVMDPTKVVKRCREWSDVPSGPHGPHSWHGHICPGLGELEALTITQVVAIAQCLDIDLIECFRAIHAGMKAARGDQPEADQ